MLTTKRSSLAMASFFLGSLALGGEIANWQAPATWAPPRARGLTTLSETPPIPFIAVTPCRILDTRGNGFTGQAGTPSLTTASTRNFQIGGTVPGVPSQCGIPSTAAAVSFNFAVTTISANGNLVVYPTGAAQPVVSSLNYQTGFNALSNAAIIPLGTSASITVKVNGLAQTVDLIADVNGYYSSTLGNPSNFFTLQNNSTSYTMFLHNANGTCTNQCGLWTIVDHGSAVWGESTTAGDGVYGVSDDASGAGVHGVLTPNVAASTAVWGEHKSTGSSGIGVYGSHAGTGIGVQGDSLGATGSGAIGVLGQASSTSGGAIGVEGQVLGPTDNTVTDSAGVRGVGSSGGFTGDSTANFSSSGVRGLDKLGIGVLGLSENLGGDFVLFNPAGTQIAKAFLGYDTGTQFGVYAQIGTIGCNGCTKLFVEPHPADASKVIHYVSLEGNEAGTYFRGTARTSRGHAVIPVPEDFRLVTDEEGLTVQLTPVGAEATMYVVSEDLNQIVVHSSKDVTFHYLVQGIRPDYRNFKAILDGREYMPEGPDARMPAAWPEKVKRALISNGTYNADGTVNRVTANRLGWDKAWEQREKSAARAAVTVPNRP